MSGWASGWVRGRDLAIDLGTANTVIYERGRGVVLDEPSVVAIRTGSSQLVAAGHRAKEMLGRTPESVTAVRPLRDGVISDADVTERMIRWFVEQVAPSRLVRPRVVVCVPSDITGVERRALEDATLRSGARRVYVIEETMAAAIGAGLPVEETRASMVVDVGGGTTDVAILSLGGIVTSRTVRIGGRDLVTGLPKTVSIGSAEVRRAIETPLVQIVELVRTVLDVCPPELAGDVVDRGIALTGGGALIRGLDERLSHELGVPVHAADDPLHAVARGAGRCVEEFSTLERLLVDNRRP